MKAVRLNEFGDVDVLKIEEVQEPNLRPHHVMIKVDSAGVNYADILRRGGNYPGPSLPSSMGLESAGTVTEVGSDVTGIIVGQQVMAMGPGSQAEYVAVNGNLVFPYPNSLDAVEAGGMPIVFLTAYHILKSRGHMQSGDTVLVQAGASGVGTVLIQLAKAWGAKVIATTSSPEKATKATELGADVVINYKEEDIRERVREITGGAGVDCVVDHVGADFFVPAFASLRTGGRYGICGATTGLRTELHLGLLFSQQKEIYGVYMGTKEDMREIVELMNRGAIKPVVDRTFPLAEVAAAHKYMGETSFFGKLILTQ